MRSFDYGLRPPLRMTQGSSPHRSPSSTRWQAAALSASRPHIGQAGSSPACAATSRSSTSPHSSPPHGILSSIPKRPRQSQARFAKSSPAMSRNGPSKSSATTWNARRLPKPHQRPPRAKTRRPSRRQSPRWSRTSSATPPKRLQTHAPPARNPQ